MKIEELLPRLKKVRRTRDGWQACCAAHEDTNPSLSIKLGDDGRILFYCHAGCEIKAICAALGITLRDLMPAGRSASSRSKPGSPPKKRYATVEAAIRAVISMVQKERDKDWSVVASYVYRDRDGSERMRLLRLEPDGGGDKTYRPIARDSDAWIVGDPVGALPLYRLDILQGSDSIVVVEGEKCADSGAAIGFCTTTSAHGANSSQRTDWTPLAGRDVVILPDNDKGGHAYADSVASTLVRLNPPARVRIVELPDLPEHGDVHDLIEMRRAAGTANDAIAAEIKALIASAKPVEPSVLSADEPSPDKPDDRQKIYLVIGELARSIDEAEAALAARARKMLVFQRSDLLVQVIRKPAGCTLTTIAKLRGEARVRSRDAHAVADLLNRAVRFVVLVKQRHGIAEDPRDCPLELARMLLARQSWPNVPVLNGVIESPVLLPDGRILARDGYDEASGMFVDLGGLVLPQIPANPTQDEACASLDVIRDLFNEFPFERAEDASVAVAALLTSLSRELFHHTPLFAFSARVRSSGKSFLIECICRIALGRPATVMPFTSEEVEARKRIFALLLDAHRFVNLDNLSVPLEGDALCSALSEETFTDRVLGHSRTASAPTGHTVFFANGNNMIVKGDICRRTLMCRLDARMEDPSTRTFSRDLRQYIPEHRAELIAAAMTVLRRAIQTADAPSKLTPFASFEDWSHVVRRIVIDLGMSDPCLVLAGNAEADPEVEDLRVLATAWHKAYGDKAATAREAVANRDELLIAAIELVAAADNAKSSARRLGNYFRTRQGRVIDRWRFEKVGERQGWGLWRLITVARPDPVTPVTLVTADSTAHMRAHARAPAPAPARVGDGKQIHQSHESHATTADGPSSAGAPPPRPPPHSDMFGVHPERRWDDGGDQ